MNFIFLAINDFTSWSRHVCGTKIDLRKKKKKDYLWTLFLHSLKFNSWAIAKKSCICWRKNDRVEIRWRHPLSLDLLTFGPHAYPVWSPSTHGQPFRKNVASAPQSSKRWGLRLITQESKDKWSRISQFFFPSVGAPFIKLQEHIRIKNSLVSNIVFFR